MILFIKNLNLCLSKCIIIYSFYGFLRKSAIKSAAMAFSESQQSSRPLWLSPKVSNQVGRSTSYDTDGAVRVSVWSMRNDARINNP
jgi:hypothetical protein